MIDVDRIEAGKPVEKSREFTLVPWRPILERHVGKSVSGIMRGDEISWSFGRGRGVPPIS